MCCFWIKPEPSLWEIAHATHFFPRRESKKPIWPMPRSSLRWPTKLRKAAPSWCSPRRRYRLRGRDLASHDATFIPFSAQTRMSGVDIDGREIRKGATDAIAQSSARLGNGLPHELQVCMRGNFECRRHAAAGRGKWPHAWAPSLSRTSSRAG